MPRFTVYKRDDCPYCQQAAAFLGALQERQDVQVKEVDAYQEPDKVRAMMQRVGRSTVPQIFLDDHHIGGWDDLARWAKRGDLDHYLETGEYRVTPRRRFRLFRR